MKLKNKYTLAILLGLSTSFSSFALTNSPSDDNKVVEVIQYNPIEGREYSLLETPIQNADTIIEFFSFNCHHCYNYQYVYQIPDKLHKTLKDNETYRYINIDGLLNAGTITQAWAMGEQMHKEKEIINEMYYGLQTKKNIKGAEDIKALFISQFGLTEEQFFNIWDSKEVVDNKEMQLSLAKQAKITSTPTFVIKGKYKIDPTGFNSKSHEEFIQQFIATVEYLKNK